MSAWWGSGGVRVKAAADRRSPRGAALGMVGVVAGATLGALGLALGFGSATARAQTSSMPARLSETGLYRPGTLAVDPANRPFAPQYPLWSDGAQKSRWVHLPAGTSIDATDLDAWNFPIGTRFWKEFTFGSRKVETRMLVRQADGQWAFASYVWNDAQTDATLAPESGVANVVEVAPGRRHSVPGVADCRACHDSGRTEVLGFDALQLSTDRDPNAPHAEPLTPEMVTLRTLVTEGRIKGMSADALARPPRIRAATPTARAALGYLSANCGGCHKTTDTIATVRLALKHMEASTICGEPGVRTTVNQPTTWSLPADVPGASVAVRPGAPEHSAILARMRSRRPATQMPPLGTVLVDREAVDLVTRWIEELGHSGDSCAEAPGREKRSW